MLVANDLCVDESSLTGEAEGVWKCIDDNNSDDYWRRDYCYAGTLVTQGRGIVRVDKIGKDTEYGKIGIIFQKHQIHQLHFKSKQVN